MRTGGYCGDLRRCINQTSNYNSSPILGTLWAITLVGLVAFTVFHYRDMVRRRLDQVGVLSGYYPGIYNFSFLTVHHVITFEPSNIKKKRTCF